MTDIDFLQLVKKVEQGTASEEERLLVLKELNANTEEYIALMRMRLQDLHNQKKQKSP